jgi:hypothetical protein
MRLYQKEYKKKEKTINFLNSLIKGDGSNEKIK